jgi:type I restriction enzyme, S subunit
LRAYREEVFFYDRTAIPQITVEQVSANAVAVPPLEEQLTIVEFLEREAAKFGDVRSAIQRASDRLKEYRAALITSAVTGKIDVRNEVEVAA